MEDDEGFSKHESVSGEEADLQRAAGMCLKRLLQKEAAAALTEAQPGGNPV